MEAKASMEPCRSVSTRVGLDGLAGANRENAGMGTNPMDRRKGLGPFPGLRDFHASAWRVVQLVAWHGLQDVSGRVVYTPGAQLPVWQLLIN